MSATRNRSRTRYWPKDVAAITDPNAKAFRVFADQTGSDRRALAACIVGGRDRFRALSCPPFMCRFWLPSDREDAIAGPPQPLADLIPGAEVLYIAGAIT